MSSVHFLRKFFPLSPWEVNVPKIEALRSALSQKELAISLVEPFIYELKSSPL